MMEAIPDAGAAPFESEIDPRRCAMCGGEPFPQACPRDGRSHDGGRVHLPDMRIAPVCRPCFTGVLQEWAGRLGMWVTDRPRRMSAQHGFA